MSRLVKSPKISVIIPTYNRARLVHEAIQSVFDQTFTDWELIVVDDGSTDHTAQVVAGFGERARYLFQENAGVSAARNAGFVASQGEYVSFLDSDDRMLPHNLEVLSALLDAQPEVGIAYGWGYFWKDAGSRPEILDYRTIEGEIPPQLDVPWPGVQVRPSGVTYEGQILSELILEDTMEMGSTLIRRACVEAVGGIDETIEFEEHWDFFLRLAKSGYLYACCRQGITLFRNHDDNRYKDHDPMLRDRLRILDRLFGQKDQTVSVPEEAKRRAYYNAYCEYALDYYAKNRLDQGADCLNHALEYGLLRQIDFEKLSEYLSQHAMNRAPKRPFGLVDTFFQSIQATPQTRAQVRALKRHVLGKVSAALAHRAYRSGNIKQVRAHALRAVFYDPKLLQNRGFVRISLESLVGERMVDRVRSQVYDVSEKLFKEAAQTVSIFISPHFDDVVLSCGGTLAHLARRKANVLLVTVFTEDAEEGTTLSSFAQEMHREWGGRDHPFKIRQAEDKAAVEYLGLGCRWLGFQDAIYRYPGIEFSNEFFSEKFDPRDDPLLEHLIDALLQVVNEHPGAIAFAPLGLGSHRDHLLVHAAMDAIKEKTTAVRDFYYYEDYPYAISADLQTRLTRLGWKTGPVSIDITDTLQDRVRLISIYESQLAMLFEDPARVFTEVEAYATRVGTKGKPRERFWLRS